MNKIVAALMFGAAACTLLGEVVYENDFSTRTSVGAVPYGGWREVPYAVGRLADKSITNPFNINAGNADMQDNWVQFEQAYADVVDIDGNREAMLYSASDDGRIIIARHRLGNTFTSGVVVAQCDLKAPHSGMWRDSSTRSVRLLVGDENFFSPLMSASYTEYLAGGVGVSMNNKGAYRFFRYGFTADYLNGDGSATSPLPLSGRWYRAVIAANLDTKKFAVSIYDMGTDHPAFNAATPAEPAYSESGIDFWCVTKGRAAAFSGISAIGIAGYGVSKSPENPDWTGRIDNIRVWHDGEECYRNDFLARRSRALGGTTSAKYEATAPATNAYGYVVGTRIIEPLDTDSATKNFQPIGFDGWRRLNNASGSTLIPSVATYSNDNAIVFNGDKNGIAAQPLGQTLTGGKVRIIADVRTVSFGGNDKNNQYSEILLGGEKLYSGSNAGNSYNDGLFARVGVTGGRSGTDETGTYNKRIPRWSSSDDGRGTNRKMYYADSYYDDPGVVTEDKWVRLEVVADLDASTYDFKIYNVCAATTSPALFAAAGEVLFSRTGIYAYQNQSAISTIALAVYAGHSYFDNVCVWHCPAGASEETLVYSNDCSTRMMYGLGDCEDALVGKLDFHPEGIDGWMRQYKNPDAFMLVGGENPALGFGSVRAEHSAYAVHDIGNAYRSGNMSVQFDMCAPSAWGDSSSGVWVWLGGDRYREGNIGGGASAADYFTKWAACGIGFSSTSFSAWSGDCAGGGSWQTSGTAVSGHWYRFVVRPIFGASASDVEVYDMGTTQPTLATATPAPEDAVATFAAVPFRQAKSALGGISCIGVQAKGVKTSSPVAPADSRLLIDNIRVDHSPSGLYFILR